MEWTPRKRKPLKLSESIPGGKQASEITLNSRRRFLGKMGAAAAVAGVFGKVPSAFAQSGNKSGANSSSIFNTSSYSNRVQRATSIRMAAAQSDRTLAVPPHTTNGDETRYSDHSASYSKPLLQDGICLVNQNAWTTFKTALLSGKNSDYEAIIIGGTRTLNGPQASYAFDMACPDATQFGNAPAVGDPSGPALVPPFDQVTSQAYGTQLVEMYWASMLRDVAFTDYATDGTATAAAAELSSMPLYRGARDIQGNVTPDLLFRGTFQGESIGPYMSQFAITPTSFGQQAIPMVFSTYVPGIDYMTDAASFLQVQNGIDTGLRDQVDPTPRYLHDWRGLGALTHVDGLYQEYLNAVLAMGTLGVPGNPGNPYNGSRTQNAFCTFGGPDIQQT